MSRFAIWLRSLLGAAILALILGGCSGGPCTTSGNDCAGSGGGGGGGGTVFAPTLVNLADAAPDRVLALSLKLNNVTLNSNTGAQQSLLQSTPVTVEMTHRAALYSPINMPLREVAVGTYTDLTVTLATTASVTFVDDTGTVRQDLAPTVTSTSVNVALPSQLNVTTPSPLVVNLTFAPSSVSIDTVTNRATIAPSFTVSVTPAAASGSQAETTGLIRMLTGVVTATPGAGTTTFTLNSSQLAKPITFNTDGTTTFATGSDISGFSGIFASNILQVQAQTQSNGTELAKIIDGENAGSGLTTGGDLQGVVRTVTLAVPPAPGPPFNVLSFGLRVQDAATTAAAPAIGSEVTITDFTAPTVFLVDQQDVDLSNLSFTPLFDQQHIRPPQEVSAIYSAVASTTAPKKLKLRLQTLDGTVGAISNGTVANQFIIPFTPPADSIFVLLTGQTTLTVIRQPSSDTGLATPTAGLSIHARGLLFWDDVSGQYFLVADQFTP